jgi:hypothetical protein
MTTVLDPRAPSAAAEYARYIDGDLLGKIVTRNLLINVLQYPADKIYTPIGRYGDAATKYVGPAEVVNDPGDGHVDTPHGRVTFEIKIGRINMGNRKTWKLAENWAFVNILHTPAKMPKAYDILIAIGLRLLGLEDENYWSHLQSTYGNLRNRGLPCRLDALPHERDFLSLCSFFITPRADVPTNYFRINVDRVDQSIHKAYRAWGYDEQRCREVWAKALEVVRGV